MGKLKKLDINNVYWIAKNKAIMEHLINNPKRTTHAMRGKGYLVYWR